MLSHSKWYYVFKICSYMDFASEIGELLRTMKIGTVFWKFLLNCFWMIHRYNWAFILFFSFVISVYPIYKLHRKYWFVNNILLLSIKKSRYCLQSTILFLLWPDSPNTSVHFFLLTTIYIVDNFIFQYANHLINLLLLQLDQLRTINKLTFLETGEQ